MVPELHDIADVPKLTSATLGASLPESFCPYGLCDGSSFVVDDENIARPCRCRAVRVAHARSRSLSRAVPPRFQDVAFDRPPISGMDSETVRPVRRFCLDLDRRLAAGEGLWLWGPRGTGKTSLAMLVVKEAHRAQRSTAIYSLPALLNLIRSTYDKGAETRYVELMEQLTSVELLVIDDMASAAIKDWVLEQLYSVVNSRYEDQRSIVFAADVEDWVQLGDVIGERTFSRLQEMCGMPVRVGGQDHRAEIAQRAGVGGEGL